MNAHTPFDAKQDWTNPYCQNSSNDPMVDALLGNAYHVVRTVYCNLGNLKLIYDFLNQYGMVLGVQSEAELKALTTKAKYARIYGFSRAGDRQVTDYLYVEGDRTGIIPDDPEATGSWITVATSGSNGGGGTSSGEGAYIPWVYANGSAAGGETTINVPDNTVGVPFIIINGDMQYVGRGFEFNVENLSVTLAQPLEEGDEVVFLLTGTPAVPDNPNVNDWVQINWLYNNGAAVGGEQVIAIPYIFQSIPAVYKNGLRLAKNLATNSYLIDTDNQSIILTEPLTTNDRVIIQIGGEARVVEVSDRTVQEIARSLNVSDSAVILSTNTASTLNGKKFLYSVEQQKVYELPLLPSNIYISAVSGQTLTYNPGEIQVTLKEVITGKVLQSRIEAPDGATLYPELQLARWRDEHDIRGWGAKPGVDASQAANDAINSGINSLYIPEGEWTFDSSIQLPDRDFTLYGAGRGSILRGSAAQIVKYPASASGFQNVHSLKFIVGANQTAIQMHKIWTADGKEEVQITRCHFYSTSVGAKFITVQGIWSGRIQDNEFYGGSKSNDTYGVLFITTDNMNSSAMNIDINNNKYVLVAYPVYYAGRTITSGGRLEGISVNNNKSIGSKIGVRLSSTLATIINGNLLHDCDSSAIELNGDFDFVISGNAELWGSVQAILIQGTAGSIPERGVISGNKINAGNGINGVVLRTNVTTPRSISITGNMIGRQASGAQTGTGVKIDSGANVHNLTVTGNTFQQLDTAIDRGGQAGDIVVGSNSYLFVTNIGAGMKSTPYTSSPLITLTGGATSEKITIELPVGITNKKPQFAIVLGTGLTSNDSLVGFYDFVNSTASQLKFTLYRMDGAVITAGSSIRLQVMANLF